MRLTRHHSITFIYTIIKFCIFLTTLLFHVVNRWSSWMKTAIKIRNNSFLSNTETIYQGPSISKMGLQSTNRERFEITYIINTRKLTLQIETK
ncbi:hypothetical protein BDC45DRAFT_499214 [Circinella umbellata]|nr:hypothetical protein BDC45DRAFT_499214 [Circinella umbellata]